MDASSDESLESDYLQQPYKLNSEGQMMTFKSQGLTSIDQSRH